MESSASIYDLCVYLSLGYFALLCRESRHWWRADGGRAAALEVLPSAIKRVQHKAKRKKYIFYSLVNS